MGCVMITDHWPLTFLVSFHTLSLTIKNVSSLTFQWKLSSLTKKKSEFTYLIPSFKTHFFWWLYINFVKMLLTPNCTFRMCIFYTNSIYEIQFIVIKWKLSVTWKLLPNRGVFPFKKGVKKFFFPFYLSIGAQKHILFSVIY